MKPRRGRRHRWTAGGGVEVALNSAWSVKAEYLYVDLGNVAETTHNLTDEGAPVPRQPFFHDVSLRSNIVRAGLNYKFGTPYERTVLLTASRVASRFAVIR
jgi:outer membrane immunogenic protein